MPIIRMITSVSQMRGINFLLAIDILVLSKLVIFFDPLKLTLLNWLIGIFNYVYYRGYFDEYIIIINHYLIF